MSEIRRLGRATSQEALAPGERQVRRGELGGRDLEPTDGESDPRNERGIVASSETCLRTFQGDLRRALVITGQPAPRERVSEPRVDHVVSGVRGERPIDLDGVSRVSEPGKCLRVPRTAAIRSQDD